MVQSISRVGFRLTDYITSKYSRSTSAGKSPKTVYTMKCPISRTKVHSILLFFPFSAAALFLFLRFHEKIILVLFFFSRLYGNSCSLAYESGIREYETHTDTQCCQKCTNPTKLKIQESENPIILLWKPTNVDNLPISEDRKFIFRPYKTPKSLIFKRNTV